MPFPPTFDNVWDITQPPDTQLANLLGQDIRNLKDDIMQRMSLLSGVLANRPTPETVNATWGGSGFGLLFFATDTGQVFQWNGANWIVVSITASRFNDTIVRVFTNPAPGISGASSLTIPANTLQIGSTVYIDSRYKVTSYTSGSFVPRMNIGLQNMFSETDSAAATGSGRLFGSFVVIGASNERGILQCEIHGPSGNVQFTQVVPYDGTDVAANALTISTEILVSGSYVGTITFDYLSVVITV